MVLRGECGEECQVKWCSAAVRWWLAVSGEAFVSGERSVSLLGQCSSAVLRRTRSGSVLPSRPLERLLVWSLDWHLSPRLPVDG